MTSVLLTSAHERGIGGVQVVLRDLAASLEGCGRAASFLYPQGVGRWRLVESTDERGRRSFRCPMPAPVRDSLLLSAIALLIYLPVTVPQLIRAIRTHHIDVINAHYLSPYFLYLVLAGRLSGIPVVVSVHGADIDDLAGASLAHRIACRLVLRGATRIVACSRALLRQTAERFPDSAAKMTCLHNAIDEAYYPEFAPSEEGRPFILCASRHVAKKGVDTLLRGFAQMTTGVPDVSLVLLGGGPLLETHRALARTLGIEARVVFAGDVEHRQVARFFAGCCMFVLPSRVEPFGLVLLEAAYYTKPIVATAVGGVPEIIADEVTGLLVGHDDPEALASAMSRLLRDADLGRRLGRAANRLVHQRFLWKHRVREYLELFEERGAGTLPTFNPELT